MRFSQALAVQSSPIGAAIPTVKPAPPRFSTLTERLDRKLAELTERGYAIQYLEIGEGELVQLFREGGDEAVRLDPDPDVDQAWYGDHEVRATDKSCIWIWLDGEVPGEISAHVID